MSIIRVVPIRRGMPTAPPPPTYAPRALWQRVERAAFSDPDMCSSGKLQTASNDAALKYGDDRHTAILNSVESAVPGLRTANAGRRADIRNGRKIDTCRKMLPLAVQDNGARLLRRIAEEELDAGDRRIVQGISFGRPRQT